MILWKYPNIQSRCVSVITQRVTKDTQPIPPAQLRDVERMSGEPLITAVLGATSRK